VKDQAAAIHRGAQTGPIAKIANNAFHIQFTKLALRAA
jgi:hypothetical protein